MPPVHKILTWNDLPTGAASIIRESYELDFKEQVNPEERGELAKDIAAFANTFGGAIVIGASEKGDSVEYHGLPPARTAAIANAYDLALRDWLSPKPPVNVCEFGCPHSDRSMISVNVEAIPGQLIGAAAYRPDGGPGDKSTGWRFPYRVGRQTDWLRPEQLPMMMDPITRRTAILLENIPPASRKRIQIEGWYNYARGARPMTVEVEHCGVDLMANVLKVTSHEQGMKTMLRIPLDDVIQVWEAIPDKWRVRVHGTLVRDDSQFKAYEYLSIPRPMMP